MKKDMDEIMETILENIKVMCVTAENGYQGAKEAFDKLESKLETLKGRKFYGIFLDGKYKACVVVNENDDPSKLGLQTYTIPGGKYFKTKLMDWENKIDKLKSIFESMASENIEDTSRPRIEFYRSLQELILLLPVKNAVEEQI